MAPKKKEEEPKVLLLGRPKNTLKMGLVGLPNVGKSTTFNVLTKLNIPAENYPFCTIDPHEAKVTVEDERFDWLVDHFKPKSSVHAYLSIFDIAGLVKNAHLGEGLGNNFLSNIAAVDGIYHVVRAFENEDIIHTEGNINPVRDMEIINSELIYKDISNCERNLEEISKVLNRNKKDKIKQNEHDVLTIVLEHLKEHKWIKDRTWKSSEIEVINEFNFLTAKPVVYLVNMSENDFIRQKNKYLAKIYNWVQEKNKGTIIPYCAEFEQKILFMTENEKEEYFKANNIKTSMLNKIIKTGYYEINLIHFFTCGQDEVKCWTIRKGTKAPQAAGVIHTDFEKGFICAEVYKYTDLVEFKSEGEVKANGKYLQKGKDYVIEDGDIVFFKFNVSSSGKK
ncbi:GTP-binding protein, putative [Plasmodium berghei]|uniref:Obg-like ATPase 1 n=2 Tax=Plasmodium berghei TaxID=5821 RepID=A0A509AHB8_PLABA|nr:Obg-like ATPase 1, putative [Plasmodium berghei ANKA]CXI20112.1 GTP-binding protein, putative [Plasmodium berghei]SCM19918.1 GTP-binding protein, putative [Plasmodium berghei]SCN23628.1 GTP-binding protein, putative [Plasmodium berghei]SCO59185.1 GTP-binding protein, putative [Plasmodium berghei]SCO59997.1 GTP-binding protein, putative [Plasmodium berghei]|eukprot:XP_034420699.1 Obg-like ATPase 1, putative [Plasmodium berghei ANKA]